MQQILFIADQRFRQDNFHRQFSDLLEIEYKPLESVLDDLPKRYTVFDIDLSDASKLLSLRDWIGRKPKNGKVIFITDKASRLQDVRAYGIGATDIIHRPIDRRTLMTKLRGDGASPAADTPSPTVEHPPGVVAAVDSLQSMFASASLLSPIDSSAVQRAGDAVVGQIEAQGLASWIETVRMYHSQTYQHCLLVTGVAVGFGQHLGVSRSDLQRLSFAGMLHDIGKARIPLAILEKPGRLDANEMAVMRKHPEYGLEALSTQSGLAAEMLDMVVHHHEYLDGSGYPHGLQASEISDLVRIMTISDVFGALIERRSYKPPMSGDAAYQILLDMGSRLDKDLVREFKFASRIGNGAKSN